MYPFNGGPTPTTSIDYIMDFFDELEGIIEKFERFKNLCDEFEDFNDPNIEIAARKYVEVKNKLKELCEYHPVEKRMMIMNLRMNLIMNLRRRMMMNLRRRMMKNLRRMQWKMMMRR